MDIVEEQQVLEYRRRMDARMDDVLREMRELKQRMAKIVEGLGALGARMDDADVRFRRIEQHPWLNPDS